MKPVICLLLALAFPLAAWADVQVKYKDLTGATSTMRSNGHRVRINSKQMPGYVLFDGVTEEFFIVDSKRKEVYKTSLAEVPGVTPDGSLNVSLRPRGSGDKIAGYKTGRFDLISNGMACGTLNGSSELLENRELKRMLQAMQSMQKLSSMRRAGLAEKLTECQQASAQMSGLIEESGFVLRYIDDQGQLMFEVLSVRTDKEVAADYYQVPQGMTVIDLNEQMDKAMQQMPETDDLIKQMEQSGVEVTPEMQKQLEDMMKQLQQQQTQ